MSDLPNKLNNMYEMFLLGHTIRNVDMVKEASVLIEQQQQRIAELMRYKQLSDTYLDIYNCKKCNGLVNRGYICFECGDANPSEFAIQLREPSDD